MILFWRSHQLSVSKETRIVQRSENVRSSVIWVFQVYTTSGTETELAIYSKQLLYICRFSIRRTTSIGSLKRLSLVNMPWLQNINDMKMARADMRVSKMRNECKHQSWQLLPAVRLFPSDWWQKNFRSQFIGVILHFKAEVTEFATYTCSEEFEATTRGQQELKHQYVNERIDVKCEIGWCLVSPGAAQTNIRSDETSAQPRSASIAVLTFLRRWGLK